MKTINVRLPELLVAEIEAESRDRRISKSDVVRERLQRAAPHGVPPHMEQIADLVGSVEGLPADLSSRVDHYLRKTGFGRHRNR
jgi:hypothetical protein